MRSHPASPVRPPSDNWFWKTRPGARIASKLFRLRGPEAGEVELVQRRVFILPTRSGLMLAMMLIALLLGSINYTLNLGYVLTFLVASMAWVGMFQTFRNLAHLHLRGARVEPVFAGEIAAYRIVLRNPSRYDRYAIRVRADAAGTSPLSEVSADPQAHQEAPVSVPAVAPARGWQTMPRVTLETTFPLGLWRAWSYWQPDLRVLVYPQPASPGTPLPPAQADGRSGDGHAGPGSEDFAGIRPYAAGDVPRHMAWKAMARTPEAEALTKLFDGGSQSELWLDLALLPGPMDIEAALSCMTRWVLDCEARQIRYGLRLPGVQFAPDHGAAQLHNCLTALALYGQH
jgi:uncharacterized protein (DUF58 family)